MKIYLHYKEDSFTFNGFYLDEYNEVVPSPNIMINQELWEYLRCLTNDFKLKENFELKELYTIEDKDIFETIPFEYKKPKPTRTDLLEKQNAFLVKESLEKDIQIKKLNRSLAQATLNSVKKDIELKKMNINIAQTTLNLVKKDIQIKAIKKEVADLMLKVGGK
ncbi:Uncharacterised protein [[Clostridium] sordellii]|uniref:hypothetical protein n=1 Tax=Paraclostridium sordellii TaxID=1505 RepID=UPI0005E77696|nr:hypothetical protein [Paeniclostridium sordellii]MCH1965955.1 hypothetical protein [Paeniclostridium sordellii]CEN84276.1 Uncharacterised protein [[Clostridium] sordellii] [Paeniclostridium sordellii]CEO09232.1 Uncharacterised protein [[Clostridium] sordellii] [Paeniclostridium sordellii]